MSNIHQRASSAKPLIKALGGNENTGMCRCPVHDDNKSSLHVSDKNGVVLVKCHAGCSQYDVLSKLREKGLWKNSKNAFPPDDDGNDSAAARSERAFELYEASVSQKEMSESQRKLALRYLNSRGIDKLPASIRLLPRTESNRLGHRFFPAVVFPVFKDGEFVGVHVTWLTKDGSAKLGVDDAKKMFGPISGGLIRFGKSSPGEPVIVAEGIETALSMRQITGRCTMAAMSAGNLSKIDVPECLEGIIGADNDAPGLKASQQLAQRLIKAGRRVRIAVAKPDNPDEAKKGFDWNDALMSTADAATLARAIENASLVGEIITDGDERLDQLAKLSPLDYEKRRTQVAKELGIRAAALDTEVKARRVQSAGESGLRFLQPVDPWPDPITGTDLLEDLCYTINAHMILTKGQDLAIGLFILHSHALNAARHSPILFINSPTKRCGKTNLLELLGRLVPKPLSAANVTPATIFRAIDRFQPTLLVDETDTFLSDKSELRGVFNSGHTKSQACVLRCVGDDSEVKAFSTWAAKAFASIGRMHPTLEDRSIAIELRRKLPTEKVMRIPKNEDAYLDLLRQCARWALDNFEALVAAKPKLPALNDRARDNWEPLLAIADACGGDWPEEARAAALKLSGVDDDETFGIQMLEDFKRLLEDRRLRSGQDRHRARAV